jgi:hypothetical protein
VVRDDQPDAREGHARNEGGDVLSAAPAREGRVEVLYEDFLAERLCQKSHDAGLRALVTEPLGEGGHKDHGYLMSIS